jgi:hypothetical protein
MEDKVFVLDGVTYAMESLPEQAKMIFTRIIQIQEKSQFEAMIHNAAVQALTVELSNMKEQFEVVEDEAPEEVLAV